MTQQQQQPESCPKCSQAVVKISMHNSFDRTTGRTRRRKEFVHADGKSHTVTLEILGGPAKTNWES